MNNNYEKNKHSCYYLKYHLVLVIKYRNPVINKDIKEQLINIAYNIFENSWGLKIDNINTDIDHIHILFSSDPQTRLSDLINNYKTTSSRLIRKNNKEFLSKYFWKPYFWSDSYFIGTVSDVTESIVNNYINNQDKK